MMFRGAVACSVDMRFDLRLGWWRVVSLALCVGGWLECDELSCCVDAFDGVVVVWWWWWWWRVGAEG